MAQGGYYGFNRAYGSLTADIEDFVRVSNERIEALMRYSIQDVTENAQTPTAKGGRMRVDTGFLWNSGRAAIGAMPSGPSVRPTPKPAPNTYMWEGEPLAAVLSELKVGDVFFFGWTANYAQYRELYDGFMEGAMMQWPRIVAFRTDQLREQIGA